MSFCTTLPDWSVVSTGLQYQAQHPLTQHFADSQALCWRSTGYEQYGHSPVLPDSHCLGEPCLSRQTLSNPGKAQWRLANLMTIFSRVESETADVLRHRTQFACCEAMVSCALSWVVKTLILVDLIQMHNTGCSGEATLVLHLPSSSWARKRFNLFS